MNVAQNTAQTQAAALVGAFTDGSLLKFYQGTPPASPETAIGSQTFLATVTLPTPAFSSSSGVMTANAITPASVSVTGTAQFFRWLKADGTTVIADGSVGTSGADCNLSSTALVSGGTLTIASFSYTIPSV